MYNIEYLSQETGISRRTIRYYIQRGLLPPPLGNRRGSYYTPEHLTRLKLIHEMASRGTPLIQIKNLIEESPDRETALPVAEIRLPRHRFERLEIARGIELNIPQHLLSDSQIKTIRDFIVAVIKGGEEDDSAL